MKGNKGSERGLYGCLGHTSSEGLSEEGRRHKSKDSGRKKENFEARRRGKREFAYAPAFLPYSK